MNKMESSGYNEIMDLVRLHDDPADPWGSNISWLCAVADYMYAMNSEILPGYRPSPSGVDLRNCPSELEDLFSIEECPEDEDFRRAYYILSRRDDWLRLAAGTTE